MEFPQKRRLWSCCWIFVTQPNSENNLVLCVTWSTGSTAPCVPSPTNPLLGRPARSLRVAREAVMSSGTTALPPVGQRQVCPEGPTLLVY